MHFAWDVSTSVIGVCMFLDDGTATRFGALFPGKFETMAEKYAHVAREIPQLVKEWCEGVCEPRDCHHFIEDRLGNFSKGQTTLQTLMKLAAMNAVVTHCIISLDPVDVSRVTHILPNVAKKWAGLKVPKGGDKKAYAIQLALDLCPSFPYELTVQGNPKKGVEDMADAFVTGIAGFRMRRAGAFDTGKAQASKKVSRRAKDRKKGPRRVRLPVPVLQTP